MERYLSFVIVGHIDHGKSTLIGRLIYDTNSLPQERIDEVKKTCEMLGRPFEFAYVIDHLHEEREKAMTIDTSQTFFKYKRNYVIIDAPGHKEFIKNMLTGASMADAAVVIIDTEVGLEEQTKRHLYLLNMLGIKQVVAVFNKMDNVKYDKQRFEKVNSDLRAFLANFPIKPAEYIPISAMNGDNIVKRSENLTWYSGPTLIETLATFKNKSDLEEEELRLPVQDVYTLDGEKVCVGRIESGKLSEEHLMAVPVMKEVRLKSVKDKKVLAGQSTGVVFDNSDGIDRGQIICKKNRLPKITDQITATLFWMGEKELAKKDKLIYKSTTQEAECQLNEVHFKFNSSTLEPINGDSDRINGLEAAEVTIKLNKKIAVDSFNRIPPMGRFVLIKDGIVEGGGIIA